MRRITVLFALLFLSCLILTSSYKSQASDIQSNRTWAIIYTVHKPQALYGHGMVYDSYRHVMVLFGGDDSGSSRLSNTWEFNGADWSLINTPQKPSGRVNITAMVFDSNRNRTVLFGGLTASGYVNDTWEYDGITWKQISTLQSPSPRDAYAAAFDTKRNVMVLFGGHRAGGAGMNETWEYNGETWQQKSPLISPPGRWYAPMVYDENRGVMVLFGGRTTDTTQTNDTWEYDGITWREVFTVQSPPIRSSHTMVYDSYKNETIMFGGDAVNYSLNDTWIYNGETWEKVNTEINATALGNTQLAYNSEQQKIIFFGGGYWGFYQPHPTLYNNTWELTNSTEPILEISHIEITQAIQDQTNSLPLISNKLTFVRVYINCTYDCSNVSGMLRAYDGLVELPGSPLQPVNRSISATSGNWVDQRSDLRKTLNFTLPLGWTIGTKTITAQIGSKELSQIVTFNNAQTLRVAVVPINYDYRGIKKSPDPIRVATGQWWANRVYPINIDTIQLPSITWSGSCFGLYCDNTKLIAPKAKGLLFRLYLYLRWFNLTHQLQPQDQIQFIYGWLPEGTFGGGREHPKYPAGFGDDHPIIGPLIFTHEVAHYLGRSHTNAGTPNSCSNPTPNDPSDWHYSDARIQDWGLDGWGLGYINSSNSVLKNPSLIFDYMSYCWGETASLGQAWTSPHTYEEIYNKQSSITSIKQDITPESLPQNYFISSGIVYTDSTAILDPVWIVTSTITQTNPPPGSEYCLQAQNSSGIELSGQCFDLRFEQYDNGLPSDVDGFNLFLPYPEGVTRFVLLKDSQELAVRTISPHSPEITITSPIAGDSWSATGIYNISWDASDIDGDSLTYNTLYSRDGSSWNPISLGITQTQITVNSADFAGGVNAYIRVIASDGVNTSSADSDSFTIEDKSPQAFILSPIEGESSPINTISVLEGYGYDLEDGVLDGSSLQWSSDIDGILGTGKIVLANLSTGQQTITFSATDSDGNTTTTSISIYVGSRIYLPISTR